jgi:hypothetical protein
LALPLSAAAPTGSHPLLVLPASQAQHTLVLPASQAQHTLPPQVGDVGSRLQEQDELLQAALAPSTPAEGQPAKGNQLLGLLQVGGGSML